MSDSPSLLDGCHGKRWHSCVEIQPLRWSTLVCVGSSCWVTQTVSRSRGVRAVTHVCNPLHSQYLALVHTSLCRISPLGHKNSLTRSRGVRAITRVQSHYTLTLLITSPLFPRCLGEQSGCLSSGLWPGSP